MVCILYTRGLEAMIIKLKDIGIEWDEQGHAIGIDGTAPEHNKPVYFNTDHIVNFHDITLKDGTIVCEIQYDLRDGCYLVGNRSEEIFRAISEAGVKTANIMPDRTVTSTITTDDYITFYDKIGKPKNEVSNL